MNTEQIINALWEHFPHAHSIRLGSFDDGLCRVYTEEGPDTNPHSRTYNLDVNCATIQSHASGSPVVDINLETSK